MFDFSDAKDMSEKIILPEGDYIAWVTNPSWGISQRNPNNRFLRVEFLIRDTRGDVKIVDYLNLYNQNQNAKDLAYSRVKAILTALGKPLRVNSDQELLGLFNGQLKVKIYHKMEMYEDREIIRMQISKFDKVESSGHDFSENEKVLTSQDIPF